MTKTEETITYKINKRRLIIAILIFVVLAGAASLWAKNNLPKFLNQKLITNQDAVGKAGQVEGSKDVRTEVEEQKQEIQNKIEEIKGDITNLKPEDIKEQEPVKKILSDLDELKNKATESSKIFDIRGNLCEEAKKRFCE
ncbi:hypothetical protein HYT17_02790 [Candidatus Microgenomates bacterium]|nr:hypothetical protein [Candidatus Microgenomates bacterium]